MNVVACGSAQRRALALLSRRRTTSLRSCSRGWRWVGRMPQQEIISFAKVSFRVLKSRRLNASSCPAAPCFSCQKTPAGPTPPLSTNCQLVGHLLAVELTLSEMEARLVVDERFNHFFSTLRRGEQSSFSVLLYTHSSDQG